MKTFTQCEEVMLLGPLMTNAARADGFNPHYILVVKDCGVSFQGEWDVICLCEDGRERVFSGHDLKSWSELQKEDRPRDEDLQHSSSGNRGLGSDSVGEGDVSGSDARNKQKVRK